MKRLLNKLLTVKFSEDVDSRPSLWWEESWPLCLPRSSSPYSGSEPLLTPAPSQSAPDFSPHPPLILSRAECSDMLRHRKVPSYFTVSRTVTWRNDPPGLISGWGDFTNCDPGPAPGGDTRPLVATLLTLTLSTQLSSHHTCSHSGALSRGDKQVTDTIMFSTKLLFTSFYPVNPVHH